MYYDEFLKVFNEFINKESPLRLVFRLPEIHINWINSSSLNAYAFTSKDKHFQFIGINYGTIDMLYNYYYTLLSCNETLIDIGENKKEKYNLDEIKNKLKLIIVGNYSQSTIPICSAREVYAAELFLYSILYLFFHEVGHHAQGHVGFLANNMNLNLIGEIPIFSSEFTYYDNSVRQALELDADRYSIVLVINAYFKAENLTDFSTYNEKLCIKKADAVDFFLTLGTIIFRIFDELSINKTLDKTSTHPNPILRSVYTRLAIVDFFQYHNNYKLTEESSFNKKRVELDSLLNKLSKYSYIVSENDIRIKKEISRLEKILFDIAPRLEEYILYKK